MKSFKQWISYGNNPYCVDRKEVELRQVGIHLSYWTSRWSEDVLPLIRRARDAGFDGAELPLLDPTNMDFKALRQEADIHEIELTCCTGLPADGDITHPDSSVRDKGLEHILKCLDGAAEVGSPVLAGVLYVGWGVGVPSGDFTPYWQRSVNTLQKAAEEAEQRNISLCLEILNRYEGYLLNTTTDGLRFLDDIGHPRVKLNLDIFHMNIEEEDFAVAIKYAGGHLGHLHCSANNRLRPGRGHIPWGDIRGALDEINYEGWLVMECFPQSGDEVGRTMKTWHPLNDDLDTSAAEGAGHLREYLIN